MTDLLNDANLIYSYTRADAIRDGVLIDVSTTAQEAGFVVPVAVTEALWAEFVATNTEDAAEGQSENGRLWDVLWMASNAARTLKRQKAGEGPRTELRYKLSVRHGGVSKEVELKLMSHAGDNGEHVMTIMLPHED